MKRICCIPKGMMYFDTPTEELIKEYFLCNASDDLKFGDPFSYKGKYYHHCCHRIKEKLFIVREFKINMNQEPKEKRFKGNITCPYCKHEINDSWEMPDTGEKEECGNCGSKFDYEREVEVTYSSYPKERFEIKEVNPI